MADTPSQRTRKSRAGQEDEAPKNDFAALLAHVENHPWTYIGAAAFVVAVLIVTGVYRLSQKSGTEHASAEFARALDIEDPAARATALAKIAGQGSKLSPRALYMQGESALEAGDREAARQAFVKLRESYPNYEFVSEAVEGLGLIQEDAGNFAQARGTYEEIVAKWPSSAAAQRQPFNIARCLEGEKDLPSAINRYRDQLEAFPGSMIAQRAQQRLTELRAEHPELFPAETAAVAPSAPATAPAATATPAAPAAPASEAPAPSAVPATPAAPAPEAAPASLK